MRDRLEGIASDGSIITGVNRQAVPSAFEPVLTELMERLAGQAAVMVYLYGSVATGRARVGRSDVDILTVGLSSAERAGELGNELSTRFRLVP